MKRRFIIMLCFLSCALCSRAQLLEVTANDTTGLSGGWVANKGDFDEIRFLNGRYTFDRQEIKKYQHVTLMMGEHPLISCVLEKGETLRLLLTNKQGRLTYKFKGKNADASIFINELREITADTRTSDLQAERQRIEANYPRVLQLAKKVKDPSLSSFYVRQVNATLLHSRIVLIDARERLEGRNPDKNHSAEMEALIAQINPNDTLLNNMGLAERFVNSKRNYDREAKDYTAMTLEYIDVVNQYVTEPKVRYNLFRRIATSVFNTDMKDRIFDLDAFWKAFCKSAPQRLVDHYQKTVDAKRSTNSGAPCPDATFMDENGKSHRLSEFFGKGRYLYIDLWATWCVPCCAEIPYIEKHVEHYKGNDRIQFISISMDTDLEAWRKKLADDKPQWQQFVVRNKQEYQDLSKSWGITGIPRFIIINPDGTINDANAFRPSALDFVKMIDDIIRR